MSQDVVIGWSGDSPKSNVIATRAIPPIGCVAKVKSSSIKEKKRNRMVSDDDDVKAPSLFPSTPPLLLNFNKASSIEEITRSTPNKDNDVSIPTTAPKSPPANLLKKLKTFLMDKRISESPAVSGLEEKNDATPIDSKQDSFPDTSTPTSTAHISRSDRRHIFDSHRLHMKRHRLILPDDSLENGKSIETPQKRMNYSDDDSLIAGLDLDAFVQDARQRRGSIIIGTPFKRHKTTGDIASDIFEVQTKVESKVTILPKTINEDNGNKFDDDSFFLNDQVFAEVEKLEEYCQSQRKK